MAVHSFILYQNDPYLECDPTKIAEVKQSESIQATFHHSNSPNMPVTKTTCRDNGADVAVSVKHR